MAIIGIGIDVVDVGRFERTMVRAPRLLERLFSDAERSNLAGRGLSAESLAARFAAKEAVLKALGGIPPQVILRQGEGPQPQNLEPSFSWHHIIVLITETGVPYLEVTGATAAQAKALGITRWHVSLTHDGGIAAAMVVAEGVTGDS